MFCQKLFYHDTFRGGVTGGSYNPTWNNSIPGIIDLNIDSESTVKTALLFIGTYGSPEPFDMQVNNSTIHLDSTQFESSPFIFNSSSGFSFHLRTAVVNITSTVNSNQILIEPPINQPPVTISGRWVQFYVLVMYENPNMEETTVAVYLNETDIIGAMNYELNNLNPMNLGNNVGLILNMEHICNTVWDGSVVFIDNNNIGIIGGDDVSSPFGCGVSGSFYYVNNTLYGLGDDIENNEMLGPDAIANIQDYINSNNGFELDLVYQTLDNPPFPNVENSNVIWQFFLVYTSTCENMDFFLLTSDTTTCINYPLQLGVTVPDTINATYEWLPQTNLSCYDCPNPVFLGNSTTNYTVRIWASDSCSKVLPVRVRVLPEPNFESIEIMESVCGGATGEILVTSTPLSVQNLFQLNGGTPQNNGNFSNLAAGAYTVTVTNAVGCSKDSVVVVGEFNNVQAAFSVNPTTGAAPLDISITNQSQNATEYFWDFSDEDGNTISQSNGHFDSAQCPLAGVYTITLIAGNGTSHCNDTTSVAILVKEPFEVFAYTFVTDDAENYQIFLSGVSEYRYNLYSLDGKLVYQKSGAVENAGTVELWEIGSMASSMYLFRIWVKAASTPLSSQGEEEEIKGKLVVVR